jgi:uncharacterized protein YfaP (DUF2135 family)
MSLRFMTVLAAAGSLALSAACSRDSSPLPVAPAPSESLRLEDVAASASAADSSGVRRSGSAPASNGGPRVTVTGNQRVINGGTLAVSISADAPFDSVYMFVGGRTLGLVGEFGGGIQGYYEIRLPSPRTSTSVLLTFPQDIALEQFDLQFAVGSPSGAIGPYSTLSTQVMQVGTGDIQVTLSWDTDADVDLHVVAPGGEEIYYGRRQASTGGQLDLDSNAGCNRDGVRNENITWPVGRAPRGRYTVRVDYWSNCGATQTNYTVLVNNGGDVQVLTGSFTGSGDRGGAGSGRTVTTFERTSGTAAVAGQALTAGAALDATKKLFVAPATAK